MQPRRNIPDPDRLTFTAVTSWHDAIGDSNVVDGIPYAPIVRDLLWWRVSRVLRLRTSDELSAAERDIPSIVNTLRRPLARVKSLLRPLKASLTSLADRSAAGQRPGTTFAISAEGRKAFLPICHRRWERTADSLRGAFGMLHIGRRRDYTRPLAMPRASLKFGREFIRLITKGLGTFDVCLREEDLRELRLELAQRHLNVQRLRRCITDSPTVVIVANDSDSPNVEAIAVAKCLGIPCLMIQHGLDCDRFCYDLPTVDHIATWGPERQERYCLGGAGRYNVRIVGNPEYDLLRAPDALSCDGAYWLWTTRPHSIQKCVLPSRSPLEGLQILNSLISALEQAPGCRLVIKPHRYDNRELYDHRLRNCSVRNRITITNQSIDDLLPQASLVITEDSTAALETAFAGKPMIHAHFAESAPVLPLVQLEAAFPGFDSDSLHHSLERMNELNGSEQEAMFLGQRAFIEQFHPLTGNATECLRQFLVDSVS